MEITPRCFLGAYKGLDVMPIVVMRKFSTGQIEIGMA